MSFFSGCGVGSDHDKESVSETAGGETVAKPLPHPRGALKAPELVSISSLAVVGKVW